MLWLNIKHFFVGIKVGFYPFSGSYPAKTQGSTELADIPMPQRLIRLVLSYTETNSYSLLV
jgi:hypothetical protein